LSKSAPDRETARQADEVEPLAFQGPGHGLGLRGLAGDIGRGLRAGGGRRGEGPEEGREALARLDPQEGLRAPDGARYLAAVADDAGVLQQAGDLGLAPGGDQGGIEALEGGAETITLAQDGDPGQPGLEAFETEEFKQALRVAFGAAPFVVVIGGIQGIGAAPGATYRIVGIFHRETFGFGVGRIGTKCEF
jgi:hypothetical protein